MKYVLTAAIAAIATLTTALPALAQVLRPVLVGEPANNYICYMVDSQGRVFDLSSICGYQGSAWVAPSRSTYTPSTSTPSSGSSGGSSSSASGPCQFPDDIADNGTRCGDRAASERPGGR